MAVSDLIADARTYAASTIDDAASALDDASNLVRAVGYAIPNYTPVTLPSAPPTAASLTLPELSEITLDLPTEPGGTPVFQDIGAVEVGTIPVLTAVPPTLNLPIAPAQVAEFLDAAPDIEVDAVFPEPPSELMNPLIDAPSIADRDAPTAPQVLLPVFDALAPTNDAEAPTDLQGTFTTAYNSALPSTVSMVDGYVDAMLAKYNPRFHEQMGRIETQLATYLDGGTGFNPAVEDAIYERSRDKQSAEARRAQEGAYGDAAARGFTLPTGALTSAARRARQDAADNNARAAREIVVQQAELEQKNLQFAVTASSSLRSTLLNATLSYQQNLVAINGQALEFAKSILGAVVETYNIAVRAFTVKLEAYKAEAAVYETRLKSAMAAIELYQAEIQALEALTNVDRARVDIYRARIESLRAYAEVYKAQVDAVLGRASLEKMKLDLFQSKVQAYTAQVQGKGAEWQAYTAAIYGESTKSQLFRSQVEAHNAQMQGYRTSIEAQLERVRAAALTNKARADNYTATLAGYTAVVQARGEKARTQLDNQRQLILSFQASANAQVANAQVQNEYYRSVSMVAIKNADLQLSAQVQTAESMRNFGTAIANLGVSSAQVYAGMAGAAMSGMNTLSAQTLTE